MKVRKAIIPAAGLGTRLLPNTKSIPKEMLPLVDKPVIQYIVEEAVAAGVEEILIITNRGKNPIEDYFDYAPDLEERLIHDGKSDEAATVRAVADMADVFFLRQKETKGLGHAVWRAKSFVGNEPFAVLLGDDIMLSEKPVLKQLVEAAEANDCSARRSARGAGRAYHEVLLRQAHRAALRARVQDRRHEREADA